MTEQEKRIAIAKECGWTQKECRTAPHYKIGKQWCPPGKTISVLGYDIPDFLNDLNAMTAAVMFLCKKKKLRCFCNSGLDLTWEVILTESNEPNCIPCDGDHYGTGKTLCAAMTEAFLSASKRREAI